VDSGSVDQSVEHASAAGLEVVELDPAEPFTAARARNAGLEFARDRYPDVELVQFVDGDCELQPNWIETARAYLAKHSHVAVVCGRRREKEVNASIYNELIDLEWDTPIGEASACGGDSMMRVEALRAVGGFDARMTAGEEPELCLRIRRHGFKVVRLDCEMTLHDADLQRFGQMWRRFARAGHAYTESFFLHGAALDPAARRRLVSFIAWGGILPGLIIASMLVVPVVGVFLPVLYLLQWTRIYRARISMTVGRKAALYASACLIGKFAELEGALRYVWIRFLRRRQTRIIEYKDT
jgi:GT2 family glycosyltransferase